MVGQGYFCSQHICAGGNLIYLFKVYVNKTKRIICCECVHTYIYSRMHRRFTTASYNGIVEVFQNSDWSRVDYDINQCQRLYVCWIAWGRSRLGNIKYLLSFGGKRRVWIHAVQIMNILRIMYVTDEELHFANVSKGHLYDYRLQS